MVSVSENLFTIVTKLTERSSISYGEDYEAQVEVFIPMAIALAVSIIIIFFILLFQVMKKTDKAALAVDRRISLR